MSDPARRLRPWPRCKTCGSLIQVSTGRCVQCDIPERPLRGALTEGWPEPGEDPIMTATAWCRMCQPNAEYPAGEILDHLRVMHPDAYGDGPEMLAGH